MKISSLQQFSVNRISRFLVGTAFLWGTFLRMTPAIKNEFPLNDGGLFYRMTLDLVNAGFHIPAYTTYNQAQIPFAYPPLAFYLAGIFSGTGISLIKIFQYLPPLVSVLTIPFFYWLAKELSGSGLKASLATFVFALTPISFEWRIMGGGLTRSIGFLFFIFTLYETQKCLKDFTIGSFIKIVLGTTASLTCHTEAGFHTIISIFLFWILSRNFKAVVWLSLAGILSIALSSFWWLPVLSNHGLIPILSSMATRGGLPIWNYVWSFLFDGELLWKYLGVLGLVIVLRRKQDPLLPIWTIVLLVISPRSSTQYAVVPLSMLAITGLEFLSSFLGRSKQITLDALSHTAGTGTPRSIVFLFAAAFLYTLTLGYVTAFFSPSLHSVGQNDLQTMTWIQQNIPPGNHFLVLDTPNFFWAARSEWFPALTDQVNLGAVQGYEWIDGNKFTERAGRFVELQSCNQQDVQCLANWANSRQVDYVYLTESLFASKEYGEPLRTSIANAKNYQLVFSTETTRVYKKLPNYSFSASLIHRCRSSTWASIRVRAVCDEIRW
jgi:hypothetical protein